MEVYRIINDYNNYSISNMGNVRNNKSIRILKPIIQANDQHFFMLYKDGKCKKILKCILFSNAFYRHNPY